MLNAKKVRIASADLPEFFSSFLSALTQKEREREVAHTSPTTTRSANKSKKFIQLEIILFGGVNFSVNLCVLHVSFAL